MGASEREPREVSRCSVCLLRCPLLDVRLFRTAAFDSSRSGSAGTRVGVRFLFRGFDMGDGLLERQPRCPSGHIRSTRPAREIARGLKIGTIEPMESIPGHADRQYSQIRRDSSPLSDYIGLNPTVRCAGDWDSNSSAASSWTVAGRAGTDGPKIETARLFGPGRRPGDAISGAVHDQIYALLV